MFARTERLLLRPGFPEDAPALARAIADERIVYNLASAKWPFGEMEAAELLSRKDEAGLPQFLMTERTAGAPRIVGACGLSRRPTGAIEMSYWVTRAQWDRGLATEGCHALIDIARALGLPRIDAAVFEGNPASERVLEKLGFVATPFRQPRYSCARGHDVMAIRYRLSLSSRRDAEPALAA